MRAVFPILFQRFANGKVAVNIRLQCSQFASGMSLQFAICYSAKFER